MQEQKIRVYEIVDQQNSSYVLEGTENTDPVRLTAPALRRIPNVSVMAVKMSGGKTRYERIRYIRGCHTILVAEQDKLGWKPSPQLGSDEIFFENGKLLLIDDGETAIVCNYLDSCALNETNPERKPDATKLFKEIKKSEETQRSIEDFLTVARAQEHLRLLVNVKGTGKKATYDYQVEKIDYLCSLFGINGLDEPGEKFHALVNFATVNPVKYMQSIADTTAVTESTIRQAIQFGVIQFDLDKVSFSDGNKFLTTLQFFKDEKKKVAELVDYFLSDDAKENFQQLEIALSYKKNMQLIGKGDKETAKQ